MKYTFCPNWLLNSNFKWERWALTSLKALSTNFNVNAKHSALTACSSSMSLFVTSMIWHQIYWCPLNSYVLRTDTRDTWWWIILNCISIPVPSYPDPCILWRIPLRPMTHFMRASGHTLFSMSVRAPYLICDLIGPNGLREAVLLLVRTYIMPYCFA